MDLPNRTSTQPTAPVASRGSLEREIELWNSSPHWAVLIWPSILALAFGFPGLVLFSGVLVPNGSTGGTLFLLLGALLLVGVGVASITAGFIQRRATKLMLTNRRIILTAGILGTKSVELGLGEIKTVEYSQSRLARTLGYATITLRRTSGAVHILQKVSSPTHFYQCLQAQRMRPPQPQRRT